VVGAALDQRQQVALHALALAGASREPAGPVLIARQ